MPDTNFTVKVDLLNEQPFLELIQCAIDLRNVAARVEGGALLAEAVRQFDAWFGDCSYRENEDD